MSTEHGTGLFGGRQIVFTRHARHRMADPRRGEVGEQEVLAVLTAPEIEYVGVDGKQNVIGTAAGKSLRICFTDDGQTLTIITVINRRGANED